MVLLFIYLILFEMNFALTFYEVDTLLCTDSLSVLAQMIILDAIVEKAIKRKSGNKNKKIGMIEI